MVSTLCFVQDTVPAMLPALLAINDASGDRVLTIRARAVRLI